MFSSDEVVKDPTLIWGWVKEVYSKLTAGEIIQPVNNFVHFFFFFFIITFFFVLVKYTDCGSNISSCLYLKKIAYISSSFLKMLKSLLYNCVEIYNSKCCPPRKLGNLQRLDVQKNYSCHHSLPVRVSIQLSQTFP